MKLSKQTSDAIQILTYCFRTGDRLVKVGDAATSLKLTKQMALKLVHILSQAGLLETVRGPQGGVRLTQEAENASLGNIVRILEDQPSSRSAGPQGILLNGYIDEAFEAFLEVLDRHSLADMAKEKPTKKRKSGRVAKAKVRRKKYASVSADSYRDLRTGKA